MLSRHPFSQFLSFLLLGKWYFPRISLFSVLIERIFSISLPRLLPKISTASQLQICSRKILFCRSVHYIQLVRINASSRILSTLKNLSQSSTLEINSYPRQTRKPWATFKDFMLSNGDKASNGLCKSWSDTKNIKLNKVNEENPRISAKRVERN